MTVKLGMWLALARYGTSGGVFASLFSHNIGMPPVLAHPSDAVTQEVLPAVLRGDKISALCITEPGGGSDVAALRTTANLDGDHYVVQGEKTFITSGLRADQAVQILGGMGYMRGTVSEPIYREVKIMMIGGDAEEIMKELAAKQMGV